MPLAKKDSFNLMIVHFISAKDVSNTMQEITILNFYNYYIEMKPKEEEISLTLKRDSGQEWGFEFADGEVIYYYNILLF